MMKPYDPSRLALLTDFYELTMMQGYFLHRRGFDAVFDMFFRYQPFGGGFAVFAGLEPFLETVLNIRFSDDDIEYLRSLGIFRKEFLDFLSDFRFRGDIFAVEEGEVVFPREPLIRVHGGIMEAQLLESVLLNIVNFQTLIATKTARIAEAARGRFIIEFGLRRAQGIDGALSASRAAYIGGSSSTSNVLAGKIFDIPVKGTMAHSWIMAFGSEMESFRKYAQLYPHNTIILVDTYDTLKSGIPNAIKVFRRLKKSGIKTFGIRLDSGDLEYLSKHSRNMLDKAGMKEAKIVASNELDEYIIEHLINKKSPIDFFGVGTNLVTARGDSALSGVYKLVARREKKDYVPSIKVSNDPGKITSPGVKNVLRVHDRDGLILGDLIHLEVESKNLQKVAARKSPLNFYHPDYDYESVRIFPYGNSRLLLKQFIKAGHPCCDFSSLAEIQKNTRKNLSALHPSYRRFLNPHLYKVSITAKLRDMKNALIKKRN